ncbi:MAG: helix-turn-helix transcriptional regulator [Roseburia sp.]|nr:helix-turn-helix transcriptional regulator [Roseburia sp.]
METEKKHSWHFDVFDQKSRWIFITPSEYAKSLGLYVTELGHFIQGGNCITHRIPENTFCLTFTPQNSGLYEVNMHFPEKDYTISSALAGKGVALVDNSPGYSIEQHGQNENYFIQFTGFLAKKYCTLLLQQEYFQPFAMNWLPSLIGIFEKLILLYRQPSNDIRDTYASMLLTKILSRLIISLSTDQPLYSENKYVKCAMEIIEEHYSEPIKLSTVADQLHINSSYLSRLFSGEVGTSFSACVTHVRINHAKEMLRTTELSIEEIGARCGFCNSSHFIRLFHANENITPMQYRNAWNQKTIN